ncbi:DUF7139 domain-containing protein [Haloarcula salina]|uniref:DUF7139 domain-containing protein n=1 Tax=Haloarcula salina TaxID=1429914 RepID=UPI003C6FDB07
MENLGDAYTSRRWEGRDPRRVVAGATLGVCGALAVVAAILLVTTPLSAFLGATAPHAAEKLGGTLGGLGIPAMLLSVVAVLPSSRREQVGVGSGAALCLVGIALFQVAYPYNWTVGGQTFAFETTMAYFLGSCVAFWFVFTAMASFRRRNDPHGTVKLEIAHKGETKTVQVSPEEYRRYTRAVRGDGGTTDQVVRELESRLED